MASQFKLLVTVYASNSGLGVSQQVLEFTCKIEADDAYNVILYSDVTKTLSGNAKREVLKLYLEKSPSPETRY
ncbi:hypothetical protein [Ewingella americana]|uniref:hypothetical protein n=1 Tax=Ewingella americana TaxID=41202 RepID=UPI00112A91BB|nr:hypothetical protein [Ewingella americana]